MSVQEQHRDDGDVPRDDRFQVYVNVLLLKSAVAIIPIIGSAGIIWLRNAHFNIFHYLFTEDGLFEYLTSVLYFGASLIAFVIVVTFKRKGQTMLAASYAFLTLALFFVAGEEISWGQRILDIETPAAIAEVNTQRELTVHNLAPVQNVLHAGYIAVGALGAFLWIIVSLRNFPLDVVSTPYVAPRWYLAPYFLPVFIMYTHIEVATPETAWFRYRSPDQEPTEFIMALGFLLFALSNRYRQMLQYSLVQNRLFGVKWKQSG